MLWIAFISKLHISLFSTEFQWDWDQSELNLRLPPHFIILRWSLWWYGEIDDDDDAWWWWWYLCCWWRAPGTRRSRGVWLTSQLCSVAHRQTWQFVINCIHIFINYHQLYSYNQLYSHYYIIMLYIIDHDHDHDHLVWFIWCIIFTIKAIPIYLIEKS